MDSECGSPTYSSSLKHMIKSSMCCFRPPSHDFEFQYSQCRKTRSQEALEAKDGSGTRSRGLFARIGSCRSRRRPYSAGFRYDPLSYALNFEDDVSREEEFPVSFLSRLPLSPDRPSHAAMMATMPREMLACN